MEIISYHSLLVNTGLRQARLALIDACQAREKGQKVCLVELDLTAPVYWRLFPVLEEKRRFINEFIKSIEGRSARRINNYLFFHNTASFHFILANPSLEAVAKDAKDWYFDIEIGLVLDRLQEMSDKLQKKKFTRIVINAQPGFNTLFRNIIEKLPEIEIAVCGEESHFQQFEKMYPNNKIRKIQIPP